MHFLLSGMLTYADTKPISEGYSLILYLLGICYRPVNKLDIYK